MRVFAFLRAPALSALACAAPCALGCGSSRASAAPSDAAAYDADDAGAGAAAADLVFTMGAHVAVGADTYGCRYVAMPAEGRFMIGASHEYTAGNHHLLVFRTDLASVPPLEDVERDCFAPDDVMSHARAQVYGTQTKTGTFALPPGVGLPLRAGEVLLMQAHYLNATAADVDARITLTIRTAKDGVTQRAGTYFFADPFIDVGSGQKGRAAIRCVFPAEATLLSASAYAHARAVDFAAFVDPQDGTYAAAPFYRAPGFANPLPLQTTLAVGAGARVRMACTYDNTRGASEIVQGPRNGADEQCVLSGVYFPDQGDDVDACRAGPDAFGTGGATCAATRSCVDACPAGSAPPADLGLGRVTAVDPCWQRCIVASCADASRLLFAVRACAAARCATECATDPSSACTSCTQSSCASEVAACAADPCR